MGKGKQRSARRRSREEWRSLIAEWSRSGEGIESFCRRRGVRAGTFNWWRWRLGRESQDESGWVELKGLGPGSEPEQSAGESFELRWSDGLTLRVPRDFDAAALERLLSVLESAGC